MTDKLEDVVRRVLEGEREAFGLLVTQTAPRLLRLATRVMGDTSEAEDVLQEAYARAHAALLLGRYQRQEVGVEAWLYRITANAALDALKAKQRWWRRARWSAEDASDGVGQALLQVQLRELSRALAQLSPELRTTLILKEVEGLTSREVAQILRCSEGAVEQRLLRAKALLRGRFSDG